MQLLFNTIMLEPSRWTADHALTAPLTALLDPVRQAGGGSPGAGEMGNLGAVELNRRITESTGLGDLERRITRLRAVIDDRRREEAAPPPVAD